MLAVAGKKQTNWRFSLVHFCCFVHTLVRAETRQLDSAIDAVKRSTQSFVATMAMKCLHVEIVAACFQHGLMSGLKKTS